MPQIGIALFRAEHDNVMVVGSIQAGISMSSALKSHYWATLFCTAVVALTSTAFADDAFGPMAAPPAAQPVSYTHLHSVSCEPHFPATTAMIMSALDPRPRDGCTLKRT